MRPFNYARTTPEARKGFPVFVVVFAVCVIWRDHMGAGRPRQRLLG
jgi:hypothetical protein